MKFDSPLFNRIRVKPTADRRPRTDTVRCEWAGCCEAGTHRAPKGRTKEREYWRFCLEHVRAYNQSYNYFAGMTDDAVQRYQKDALTGHRPTWKMGLNGKRRPETEGPSFAAGPDDPYDLFAELGGSQQTEHARAKPPEGRHIGNVERKALESLGLEGNVTWAETKARFKILVKRHHPDVNGGDRSTEDKLREIIQAYNYLKTIKSRRAE